MQKEINVVYRIKIDSFFIDMYNIDLFILNVLEIV